MDVQPEAGGGGVDFDRVAICVVAVAFSGHFLRKRDADGATHGVRAGFRALHQTRPHGLPWVPW